MKTKEELNALKEEVETLNKKLHELTEEELAQVSGGNKVILNEFFRKLADKYFEIDDADRLRDSENKWNALYQKEENQ